MRPRRRAYSLIAILTGAAVLTLIGAAEVVAASRSMVAMRGPTANRMAVAPNKFSVANKRFVPRRPTISTNNVAVRTPKNPRQPVHGRPGGPGLGPVVVGTGIAVSTGVIGTPAPGGVAPPGAFASPSGPQGPRGPQNKINIPPANENRFVKNEVVLELGGNFSSGAVAQVLARHRLVRLEQQNFTLTNTTYLRARIADRRSVRAVLRALGNEVTLRSGQPNYLYRTSQQATAADALPQLQPPPGAPPQPTPVAAAAAALPAKGDPAQYALAKLHLDDAHRLALGSNVLVAVIDSGVDISHPELAGVIADSYDALGKGEKPHRHGTAIAGAIAAHSRLLGVAPAARILAIRAFGAAGTSVEATSFAILKGLEYAARRGARIINMSFTGPFDPGLARHLAAAHAKGAVLVAAAGNLGPKSPPQYPAADSNVIAVTATDADDKLFVAANRGNHVAIAAPGVDILLPAPQSAYWMASGTSFAAAHVSGVAALILSRQPELAPDAVRQILLATAHDLGPPGYDPQFGAGLADAYRAIVAVGLGTVSAPAPIPVVAGKQ